MVVSLANKVHLLCKQTSFTPQKDNRFKVKQASFAFQPDFPSKTVLHLRLFLVCSEVPKVQDMQDFYIENSEWFFECSTFLMKYFVIRK